MNELFAEDCLEYRGDKHCRGEVLLRPSLTGTGTSIARCDHHWEDRLLLEDQHRSVYPDSDIAPPWFDEEEAGERWNDDY